MPAGEGTQRGLARGGARLVAEGPGENILIVRRAEKYLSLETQAGGLVHVVGVFGHETHRDKQYGVLKDARIDPADIKVTKPLNP